MDSVTAFPNTYPLDSDLDKDFKQLSLPSFKKVENAHARELF